MDGKRIRFSQIVSQHVSIYLQQFPVIRTASTKQKIAVFTYHSPHFCFPWRRPCDYHAICCMDGKTIQCLPNPSLHVPIYLQQFPSYMMLKSMRKSKNRYFTTFLFPLGTSLRQSRWMVYGWKENSMLTNCLAACAHLTITVSEIERDIGRKSSFFRIPLAFDAPVKGVPVGTSPSRLARKN